MNAPDALKDASRGYGRDIVAEPDVTREWPGRAQLIKEQEESNRSKRRERRA